MTSEEMIRAVLELEQDRLWEASIAVHAEFMAEYEYSKANLPLSQRGRYGFKIEKRRVGVTLKWVRFEFFGPKGKRRRMDRAVNRGDETAYPMSAFPTAQPWEKTLIREIEEKAEPLRIWSNKLVRISQMAPSLNTGAGAPQITRADPQIALEEAGA
ncbi:conjugative transfer protein MobI(A/C) [Azospirillum sp. SYSU D00513]|uniref:conjugative transfer protein MobI(A/C) n=1 Tax=Azospirillum sp. SYSU D00513 TaxID=2812561 RepID=UPI001A958CA4|nr:conjugative transfer protein MobI(A/C) [Azospirillum sp. SYSU D00513]